MKKFFLIFNAFIISVIATLIIVTLSFLLMLFSSKEDGFRSTFFNAIYFKSTTSANGVVSINFGVQNFIPIFWTVIIIFVFVLLTMNFYNYLLARKKL